jgi:hypothetical protein
VRFFERDDTATAKASLAAWEKPGLKTDRQETKKSNRIKKLTDRKKSREIPAEVCTLPPASVCSRKLSQRWIQFYESIWLTPIPPGKKNIHQAKPPET